MILQGYRTYIVAAVGVLYAVFAFFSGHIDANGTVELIVTALAAAGIHSAVVNK